MTQRFHAIDYLRVMMAAFVVLGHARLGLATFGDAWIVAANSIFRAAVPVFAVISGYFLLHSLQRGQLWSWCRRILTLYVIWSLIYYLFLRIMGTGSWLTTKDFLYGFWHLWFLEALVIGALMIAALQRLGDSVLVIAAVLCAVTGIALQYADMTGLWDLRMEVYRSGPFFLFPCMAAGFLIARGYRDGRVAGLDPRRIPTVALVAVATLGLCLALIENAVALPRFGRGNVLEIPAGLFLLCPAIFALTLRLDLPEPSLPLARISSAIYILHVFFIFGLLEMAGMSPLVTVLFSLIVPSALVLVQTRTGRGRRWMSWAF